MSKWPQRMRWGHLVFPLGFVAALFYLGRPARAERVHQGGRCAEVDAQAGVRKADLERSRQVSIYGLAVGDMVWTAWGVVVGTLLSPVCLWADVAAPGLGIPVGHQTKGMKERLGYVPQVSDDLAGARRPVAVKAYGYTLNGDKRSKRYWREREGVEPTTDCAGSPPAGFEAREAHRDPSAPKMRVTRIGPPKLHNNR